jgi:hypothetical protein
MSVINNNLQEMAEAALGLPSSLEYPSSSSSSSSDSSPEDTVMNYGSTHWEDVEEVNDTAFTEVPLSELLDIEAETQIEEDEYAPDHELTQLPDDDNYQEDGEILPLPEVSDEVVYRGRKAFKRASSGSWLSNSDAATEDGFLTSAQKKQKELDEYEDGLREAGFELVDALLHENHKLFPNKPDTPSLLRRCWIAPEEKIDTKKNKQSFRQRQEDLDA